MAVTPVSSLVLMRILESAPRRYDAGMELLTFGVAARSRRDAAGRAALVPGARILEIGCGTGALTSLLLRDGASVLAIDEAPEMLDIAAQRLGAPKDQPRLVLQEKAAAEIDGLEPASFDVVTAAFALSEMSASERAYVLGQAARLLVDGGRLVLVDETLPRTGLARFLFGLLRLPLSVLAWVLAGRTSSPLPRPEAELAAAGLSAVHERSYLFGTIGLFEARKGAGA